MKNTDGEIGIRTARSRPIAPRPPAQERELSDQISIADSINVVKITVSDVPGVSGQKEVTVQLLSGSGFKYGKAVRFELGLFADDTLSTLTSEAAFLASALEGTMLGNASTVILAKTDSNGLFKCRIEGAAGAEVYIAGSPARGSALLDYEDVAVATFSGGE